jgi:tRNA modification GTPase
VVLVGLPNAGKSSLFNVLAGREAALVSERRGTTRDYLTAELDWHGAAVELVDTAGWEPGGAGLMQQAHALRVGQLEGADLVLFCTPADADQAEPAAEARFREELDDAGQSLLTVLTKCDLIEDGPAVADGGPALCVSARARTGLRELIDAAAARLTESHAGERQLVGMTAARSRESLAAASSALDVAADTAQTGAGHELVALEVRSALDHLGRILGAVYTDDILDRIFSRFCIGK